MSEGGCHLILIGKFRALFRFFGVVSWPSFWITPPDVKNATLKVVGKNVVATPEDLAFAPLYHVQYMVDHIYQYSQCCAALHALNTFVGRQCLTRPVNPRIQAWFLFNFHGVLFIKFWLYWYQVCFYIGTLCSMFTCSFLCFENNFSKEMKSNTHLYIASLVLVSGHLVILLS